MPQQKIKYEAPDGKQYDVVVDVPVGERTEDTLQSLDTHWMENHAPAAGKPPDDAVNEVDDYGRNVNRHPWAKPNDVYGPDWKPGPWSEGLATAALGMGAGKALEALPFLKSAVPWQNMLLGAGKGVATAEAGVRGGKLLSGQPQPPADSAGAVMNDAMGATLGGIGGYFRAPQPPGKPTAAKAFEDAQQQFQTWKAAKDDLAIKQSQAKTGYDKLAPVEGNLSSQIREQEKLLSGAEKSAKTSAQRAFVQGQAKYRTAIAQKQAEVSDLRNEVSGAQREAKTAGDMASGEGKVQTGNALTNLDDQILAEQEKLAKLKGSDFEADPETVAELKKVIKKHDANVASLKGGAKMGAQRRLDEAKAKLDEVRGGPASDEEANSNAILESQRKLRELQASKSQISRTGISSIDEGMLNSYGNNTKQSALEAFQKKQQELNALKVGQKQHAELAAGSDPKFVADTQALNDLRDKHSEVKAQRHDLFNESKNLEHELKVHSTKKPSVPKAPTDGDKVWDVLKALGIKVPAGSIPGALTGVALNHLGVSGPVSAAAGAGVTGLTAALTQTPQGQALLRQAPNVIPLFSGASIPLADKIKEMLGGKRKTNDMGPR